MATPAGRKLEYADYTALPDDGRRYEILDGALCVTPSPSPLHQRVSRRLQRALEAYFEPRGGEVFDAPIDLILGRHDIVVPDLLVVTEPAQVSGRGIEGAPRLVVEVLSPSTRRRDTGRKAERYAALGVPRYWVVDPDGRSLECRRLADAAYTLVARVEGDAVLEAPGWPDLVIHLADLWR